MSSSIRRVNVGPLERGLSLAAGALALSRVGRSRGIRSLVPGAAGAYLVYRGLSGRCLFYRWLGKSGSEVGSTVTAFAQTTVQRPVDEVYAFWKDPRRLAESSRGVERVEAIGPGAWRVHARTGWGQQLHLDIRRTVDEPRRRLAWCATEHSSMPGALEVRFNEGRYGTEVFVDAWFVPPVAPILSGLLQRVERSRPLRRAGLTPSRLLKHELHRLRQLLEVGETATIRGQSSGRAEGSHRLGMVANTSASGTSNGEVALPMGRAGGGSG